MVGAMNMDMVDNTKQSVDYRSNKEETMKMHLKKHGWKQIDGDIDPATYGGTIAKCDGESIELLQIQPVRGYVGDGEAVEVGFPFWTKRGYFTLDDLDINKDEVGKALECCGLESEISQLDPHNKALYVANCLLDYGHGEEGPYGWSRDIITERVQWFASKRPCGSRFLATEDRGFKQLIKETK